MSILLIALSIASLVSISPSIFHSVHAAGLVYVDRPTTAVGSASTVVTVRVQVAGVDPFNGWDIQVESNQSVISPISLSITGNGLEVNYSENVLEIVSCINGVSYTANPCDSSDGPGIVHSEAVAHEGNPPTSSAYGLLFAINYTVIRSGSYSPLQILRAVITNHQSPVSVTTRDGTYGIPLGQGFELTASPDSPRIVIGSKANVTFTVSSYGGYAGTIDLTLGTQPPGLMLLLNASSTLLSPNHPSNVTLTIATDTTYQANQYTVMVTATSNGLSHTAAVSILTTDKPDFILDASPLILEIHATASSSSIITLHTPAGFAGPIQLSVTVPGIPGLIASLGSRNLIISPGSPTTTVLDIHTPDSPTPFVYRVNITATSQFSSHMVTVIVIPPQPDFSFLLSGSGRIIQAGESRTFILAMTSVDYFKGQLFLFASSRLGFEEVFSPPTIALDFGNSSTSTMTLTTDANSEPGNRNVTLTAIGTTSIGASVTHIIVLTLTITRGPSSSTILGFMSLTYLGTGAVGALSLATILFAVRKARSLKHA
ncbi:MAG: hypothetical protein AUF79_16965 [Crenarchaeota archaeon 13_1_20CM_2_51_8]|nr:MAG: hypothetical protein AUF79_16965 [Crenarchaeota archaeon 13_1_20CM_2_51_8]